MINNDTNLYVELKSTEVNGILDITRKVPTDYCFLALQIANKTIVIS